MKYQDGPSKWEHKSAIIHQDGKHEYVQVNNYHPSKSSWSDLCDDLDGLNHSLGRSLSPISFRGGFSVSGSWCLFILMFIVPSDPGIVGPLGLTWFLSLFWRFR